MPRHSPCQLFILEVIKPFKWWIALQSVAGVVWAIDLSLRPYILKVVIDTIANTSRYDAVNHLLVPLSLYILLSLVVVILFRLYDIAWIHILAPMKSHIASLLTKKLLQHNIATTQSRFSGSLANLVSDVMNGVPEILKIVGDKFCTQFLAACVALTTVATIGVAYAAMLLVWLLCFILGSIYFTKRLQDVCSISTKQKGVVSGQILDILSNIASVQMFATSKKEESRLKYTINESILADQQRDRRFMIVAAFQGLTFIIYQITGLILLVIGFKHGVVSAGDFILLLNVNIAILGMLRNFSNELLSLSMVWNNVSHGITVALAEPDIIDAPNAITMRQVTGTIVFDNVTFSYNANKPIFVNKSLTIKSGEKIGLVGYSGGGKSTFINLIMRLYDVDSGKITIDGYDLRDVTLDSLRYHISIIPQDTILFHRTILENISYGANASFDAVVAAAIIARAHDFIMLLPNDYHTLVGDRGSTLSGGQRQRIAIARAILKNAPIVILDEPTSQLDSITESFLQDSFLELVAGKTTIVVAHRLSTLVNMDRILVFDAGVIVEDGSHEQLLQLGGLYTRLWGTQDS
jgi:ATP-binding cassette subfamily B protein